MFFMKFKKIVSFATLLAVTASFACGCGESAEMGGEVEVFELKKQPIIDSVSTSGTIEGVYTEISNNQNTKAVKVNVREGDYVEKGDILFEFDSAELKEQYDKLASQYEIEDDKIKHEQSVNEDKLNSAKQEKQAMLSQAQRKINEAESLRDEAYSNRDKLQNQYDSLFDERNVLTEKMNNAGTDEEYAEFYTKIEEASLKLTQLEAELAQINGSLSSYDHAVNDAKDAYSNLERQYNDAISDAENLIDTEKFITNPVENDKLNELKKQMESCTITAPVSGVVLSPTVVEGMVPMGESLVTIVDTSDLFVKTNVSEADIFLIKEGMNANIKTVATDDLEISGTVTRISKLSQTSEAGSGYPIEIDIDDKMAGENVFLGMTSRNEIIIDKTDDVLAVPYDAIIDEAEGKSFVMAAIPDGDSHVVKKIYVEVGFESDYYVEVSASELSEGMYLLSYPEDYSEGDKVNILIQ